MLDQQILNIFTDGGSRGNPGPAASAFVALTKSGEVIFKEGQYLGSTTNNQAEYGAVLLALRWLSTLPGNYVVKFFLDSQLVVNQINGKYKVNDINLAQKLKEIKYLIGTIPHSVQDFIFIPREKNTHADKLVNQTLDEINSSF